MVKTKGDLEEHGAALGDRYSQLPMFPMFATGQVMAVRSISSVRTTASRARTADCKFLGLFSSPNEPVVCAVDIKAVMRSAVKSVTLQLSCSLLGGYEVSWGYCPLVCAISRNCSRAGYTVRLVGEGQHCSL